VCVPNGRTTVGYGNVHPCTTHERIYAIFAMGMGAWIFAYGITNVVAMVSNLNATDSMFQLRMDELNDYMEARELPTRLRYEIREFFFNARISAESKLMNEGKILAELSALLRSKIAFAINDSVLNKMPFFAGADHNFLMELALSMRMVCFPPMEEVILEGEIGEEMFFIFRGVVEIVMGGVQLGLLGQKQYFGEMAILNQNCLRTATVRTLCFCELRMLTREKFLIALTHYPAMKQRIARIVDKRARNKPRPDASRVDTMRRASDMTSLEKMAATSAIDEKTAMQLSVPTQETTLSRISQLNSDFSGSFRFRTAESDLEAIQERIAGMMQQQASLAQVAGAMESRMSSLDEGGTPTPL
jgi:CRP-like cAMP-binding protein